MERGVVFGNRTLEELHERLSRWDELCAQLRELYYKYLDLAAFRSEKCYFPGRRCKRSWKRQYDLGDLTLMWTYIANTAPLCGKLIKALAEVEYKARLNALESFEKYGGVEKRTNPSGKYEIVNFQLKRPVYGYLVLWDDKLYVIWGEFDGLSKDGKKRAIEIERGVLDVIERQKRIESVEMETEEYEVEREYERLWLEVHLPEGASKLLGGRSKAPVALLRNLGWLLSDDDRFRVEHTSGNLGQAAMRVFDWIAIAMYAKRALQNSPLVFRQSVYQVVKTKEGMNPLIKVWAVGTAAEIIQAVYGHFGIALSRTEELITRGYAVLNALREEAFKREGLTYVVDNVGAWIAFSTAVATLALGDGSVVPFEVGITTKRPSKATSKQDVIELRKLAKALGGAVAGKGVHLQGWHMRLLLPAPATPVFEKTVKLYDTLVNYPAAAMVEINGIMYLLTHKQRGQFIIGKERAAELYETIKQLGLKTWARKNALALTYAQLRELAKLVPVRLLNEVEKESIKEVRAVPSFDLETIRKVLEEVAKVARIALRKSRKYECVMMIPYDKSKLWEIVAMLKAAGIRVSVERSKRRIYVCEQRSVEAIRRVMTRLFSNILLVS